MNVLKGVVLRLYTSVSKRKIFRLIKVFFLFVTILVNFFPTFEGGVQPAQAAQENFPVIDINAGKTYSYAVREDGSIWVLNPKPI